MDEADYNKTREGDKVLAHIGNSLHVARVLRKHPSHQAFRLRFRLANGERQVARRYRHHVERCDQSVSVGPVNRTVSKEMVEQLARLEN